MPLLDKNGAPGAAGHWRRKSGKDRNRGFLQKTSGGRKTALGLLHGFLRGFRNRLIGKFLADARQIGDLVLAVFGEVVVLAGAAVAFQERVAVEFVDREVRNSRLRRAGDEPQSDVPEGSPRTHQHPDRRRRTRLHALGLSSLL